MLAIGDLTSIFGASFAFGASIDFGGSFAFGAAAVVFGNVNLPGGEGARDAAGGPETRTADGPLGPGEDRRVGSERRMQRRLAWAPASCVPARCTVRKPHHPGRALPT